MFIVAVLIATVFSGEAFSAQRRALLIGVGEYPSLGERYQLSGPVNDVGLMRSLLIDRFEFPDDHASIRVLTDDAGKTDIDQSPIRENIVREFQHLADVSQAGDLVVIFMAGHGAQKPATGDDGWPEPDGLDEIFLPRDVGTWQEQAGQGTIPNAIIDNEIAQWLQRIHETRARVWVIFDCCHSGDITRGFNEQERFVSPDSPDGLRIPASVLAEAERKSAAPADGDSAGFPDALIDVSLDGIAVLYACQPHEKTLERDLPERGSGRRHGLLTWSLNSILARATGPLSYRELGRQVYREYVRLGRLYGPTPLVEGGDIDREVLGSDVLRRPRMTLTSAEGRGLIVNAGHLHGLTVGTVLNVARNGASVGRVRVTEVQLATAHVRPIESSGIAAALESDLDGGECETAEIDYGDLRIPVAVDVQDNAGRPVDETLRLQLEEHVIAISDSPGSLVAIAASAEQAEWFVRSADEGVYLVPRSAWSVRCTEFDDFSRKFPGPLAIDDSLRATLSSALSRVARAQNLLELAATADRDSASVDSFAVGMEIDVRRLRDSFDRSGESMSSPARVQPGDRLQYEVSNRGGVPFDLTVLYVDSHMGISAHFPTRGRLNRIQPGESLRLPRVRMGDETRGREYVVFIAIEASGPPADLTALTQPEIEGYRSTAAPRSMLSRLLENAMYGEGGTRSGSVEEAGTWRITLFSLDI